jgi:hypothetical protein
VLFRRYRLIYRVEGPSIRVLRCWDPRRNPADLRVVDLRVVASEPAEE